MFIFRILKVDNIESV